MKLKYTKKNRWQSSPFDDINRSYWTKTTLKDIKANLSLRKCIKDTVFFIITHFLYVGFLTTLLMVFEYKSFMPFTCVKDDIQIQCNLEFLSFPCICFKLLHCFKQLKGISPFHILIKIVIVFLNYGSFMSYMYLKTVL